MSAARVSSRVHTYSTPDALFRALDDEFAFGLDVCAVPETAKCSRFFGPHDNAIWQRWEGVCWMNPPYGRTLGLWMRKAWESAQAGATVVCLVPSRTDTAWWHDFAARGEVRFVRGRLRFGGSRWNAPFPSAVVIFRPSESSE